MGFFVRKSKILILRVLEKWTPLQKSNYGVSLK